MQALWTITKEGNIIIGDTPITEYTLKKLASMSFNEWAYLIELENTLTNA